jgi:hypothetical protein
MTTTSWVRFRHDGRESFGVLRDGHIALYGGDMFDGATATGHNVALVDVQLLMPVRPGKVLALWNNFGQLAAKLGLTPPPEPLYFMKTPNGYLDPGGVIRSPAAPVKVIYEGELGIVIGLAATVAALHRRRTADVQAHRAVLELRDLGHRVERRIGQPIDRRLVVAEGTNTAPRGVPSSARAYSVTLPRRDQRHHVARRDALRRQVQRMHQRHRIGFDRVQHAGAPRHAAGMPVLELAAGDQHHRVLGIGPLGRGNDVRGHEPRGPLPAGSARVKTTGSPGSPSCRHG